MLLQEIEEILEPMVERRQRTGGFDVNAEDILTILLIQLELVKHIRSLKPLEK